MIRRKIFYTPGLISLFGLAAVLLYYLESRHVFDKFNVLIVNWDYFSPSDSPQQKKHFFENLQDKKYTDIILDNDAENNSVKLRFAQLMIKEILATDDLNSGVHFKLTDEMPYETFVWVMEIYMIENSIAYYSKDNDIWVFNYKPLPEDSQQQNSETVFLRPPTFICGTGLLMDTLREEQISDSAFPKAEKKHLLLLTLFLMLVFFSWKKMRTTL